MDVHCASSTFPSSSQLRALQLRMSGPVTIQAFSGSWALIQAGAEKSSLAPALAWPLAFGPAVCGPPTTPWWRLPSLAVPPAETETEGDEADEAGAAGGIVKVLCSPCRRRKSRFF